MVCICSLRTQQRAKSQCIKHIPPLTGTGPLGLVLVTEIFKSRTLLFGGVLFAWFAAHCGLFGGLGLLWIINGEFDPGSGRTLAACLTHASRAERPFGVLERRTGE